MVTLCCPGSRIDAFVFAHFLLSGWLFVRALQRMSLSWTASAFTSATLVLSGYALSISDSVNNLPALVGVPLALGTLGAAVLIRLSA